MGTLLTVGEIARQAGVELHRAEYLLRSRRIVPSAKAGSLRVFDPVIADQVIAELKRMKAARRKKAAGELQEVS